MRKEVGALVIALVLTVPVLAAPVTIKSAVESFFIDATPAIAIGDGQHPDDQLASYAFANEFGLTNYTTPAQLGNATDKVLVVLGGPCANALWVTFTGETCGDWNEPEGRAVILTQQSASGKPVLLISGTTGKDTRAAAKYVLTSFSDAIFNQARVVIETDGLPLASDALKVYKEAGTLEKGQSSAKGSVIIEVPDNPTGGTMDIAEGLQKYLLQGYPYATVDIRERSEVSLGSIFNKILVVLSEQPLISVEKTAPADHVVIASAAAFWLAGQGYDVQPPLTHNQLAEEDLDIG